MKKSSNSVQIFACGKDTQSEHVARRTFFRCSTVQLSWNYGSKGLLVLVQSYVDKTNQSYYGETKLNYLTTDGTHDGLVPLFLPAMATIFDKKCNPLLKLGTGPYNTIQWNPKGKFLCLAGFGNLHGDMVSRPSYVPPNTRDALYHRLPPGIKSTLRSKLQSFHLKKEDFHPYEGTMSQRFVSHRLSAEDRSRLYACWDQRELTEFSVSHPGCSAEYFAWMETKTASAAAVSTVQGIDSDDEELIEEAFIPIDDLTAGLPAFVMDSPTRSATVTQYSAQHLEQSLHLMTYDRDHARVAMLTDLDERDTALLERDEARSAKDALIAERDAVLSAYIDEHYATM